MNDITNWIIGGLVILLIVSLIVIGILVGIRSNARWYERRREKLNKLSEFAAMTADKRAEVLQKMKADYKEHYSERLVSIRLGKAVSMTVDELRAEEKLLTEYIELNENLIVCEHGRMRNKVEKLHELMTGIEFEHYCADILRNNGFINVSVTEKDGDDRGADVLAEKDGSVYAVQCKLYKDKVPRKTVQEIYAGMALHKADYGVIMTNSTLTPGAARDAEELGILIWDRGIFVTMSNSMDVDTYR